MTPTKADQLISQHEPSNEVVMEYAARMEKSGNDPGLHNKLYASDTDEENATQHRHVHGQD